MNVTVERRVRQAAADEMASRGHSAVGAYAGAYTNNYNDDGGIDIHWLWLFLKRRFWMIATVVVLGTLIAAVVGHTRPVLYTATAKVVIEPTDTSAFGLNPETGSMPQWFDDSIFETEMDVARSPEVTFTVIDELGLERGMALSLAAWEESGGTLAPALQPFARVLDVVPTDILVAAGFASEVVRLEARDPAVEARRMAFDYVQGGLAVYQSGRSRVFSISFTGDNPSEAARVANTLADAYVNQQLARKVGGTSRAASYLEIRVAELEEELRQAEQAIRDYRDENQLIETSGASLSEQELSQLSRELIEVRAEREDTEGRLAYLRGLRERGADALETVGEILESPLVAVLVQEHISLKRKEAELLSVYGDRHPQLVSVRVDLEGIVSQISGEVGRYIASLQNEISLLAARERAIGDQMDRATTENVELAQASIGLRELEREADAKRNLYNALLVRLTESREQRQVIEADARVIARAETPSDPSSPGVPLFAAVGFVASGMLGLLLALVRERLDRGLRSKQDVESQLGVSCLGHVPFLKQIAKSKQKPHTYLLDKPRSAYAEAIRSVGTSLRLGNVDCPPRLVQITSSLPGEGKSTFAIGLATTLVNRGHSTVLVDLDLHHPSVAPKLGLAPERCLIDMMVGDATLHETLLITDFGLAVVPTRRSALDISPLIGSQRMHNLLQHLRCKYDYVIIDSPPVLLVSDPKVTSELVDATILLVRWQETSADKAQNALHELDSVNAKVAGVVLSQVDLQRQQQYGYVGVGSYYKNYRKYYVG